MAENTPWWQQVCEAADTISDLIRDGLIENRRNGVLWEDLPAVLHDTANRLQHEAEQAAERDQLVEDVAAFLYRNIIGGYQGSLLPEWNTLPPDSSARLKYRGVAEHFMCWFDIHRVEVPF